MIEDKFPQKLDRKIIYESDWVSLYSDKVQMPDGHIIGTYHNIHYPNEAVCVVICNENDEILMIQSKRYITNRLEWEIPAGGIEKAETPEEAAKRECMEETGCEIKDLTYLCCHNPSNGSSDLLLHVFAAKVKNETGAFDENEVRSKRWIKKDQVIDLLKKNETHCGVSMLALLYAIQFYL
jgi:8-oxo-dGTP pyrophosphatase MutT (NUDIX family)